MESGTNIKATNIDVRAKGNNYNIKFSYNFLSDTEFDNSLFSYETTLYPYMHILNEKQGHINLAITYYNSIVNEYGTIDNNNKKVNKKYKDYRLKPELNFAFGIKGHLEIKNCFFVDIKFRNVIYNEMERFGNNDDYNTFYLGDTLKLTFANYNIKTFKFQKYAPIDELLGALLRDGHVNFILSGQVYFHPRDKAVNPRLINPVHITQEYKRNLAYFKIGIGASDIYEIGIETSLMSFETTIPVYQNHDLLIMANMNHKIQIKDKFRLMININYSCPSKVGNIIGGKIEFKGAI